MATRIKLKRGSGTPANNVLQEHEVAMDAGAANIYVGVDNAGTIEANILANNYTDADAVNAIETASLVDMQNDLTVQGVASIKEIQLDSMDFNGLRINGDINNLAGSFDIAGTTKLLPYNWNGIDLQYFSMLEYITPNQYGYGRWGAEEVGSDSGNPATDNGNHNSVMFLNGANNKIFSAPVWGITNVVGSFTDTSPLEMTATGFTLNHGDTGTASDMIKFKVTSGDQQTEGALKVNGNLYEQGADYSSFSQSYTADGNTDVFDLDQKSGWKITGVEVNGTPLAADEFSVDNGSEPATVDLTGGDNPYGTPGNGDNVELFSGGSVITNYELNDDNEQTIFKGYRQNEWYGAKYESTVIEIGESGDPWTYVRPQADLYYNNQSGVSSFQTDGQFTVRSASDNVQIEANSGNGRVTLQGENGNILEAGSIPYALVNVPFSQQGADAFQYLRQNQEDTGTPSNNDIIADDSEVKFNFLMRSYTDPGSGGQEELIGGFTAQTNGTTGNRFIITMDERATGSGTTNLELTEQAIKATKPVCLPNYTVATAPSTADEGEIMYVTDGDSGSKCLAVYDGSDWKVVSLGATIST